MEVNECTWHWEYRAQEEFLYSLELGWYCTAGLEVIKWMGEERVSVHRLHDVAADLRLVKGMAALFTLYQLSPVQLEDAVADMLP